MKAIVYTNYGPPDVLHLEEVKKPALNEDQVLVKVYAATIFHDRDQKKLVSLGWLCNNLLPRGSQIMRLESGFSSLADLR